MNYKYTEIVKTEREIKTEPFYKNLVKVYDTKIVNTNGFEEKITKIYIAPLDNVKKVKGLNTIDKHVHIQHLYQESAIVYMLSKENYNKLLTGEKAVYDEDVIEYYDDKKYLDNQNDYMIVLFNWNSYELTDLDGNYIPIAVHVSYDYSHGRMTNKYYDLTAIVNQLKDNVNVFCYNDTREKCDLEIKPIPYYNSDEEEYEQLDFYFVPSKELYNEAYKKSYHNRITYMLEKMFGIIKKS